MLVSQHELKEEMEKAIHIGLSEKEMTVISYTDNSKDIFWEEEDKEFSFKGEMYDVVKTVVVKGKKIIYCVNDKKEKALIEKYNALSKHNSHSPKKQKNTTPQFVTLFVYESKEVNICEYASTITDADFYHSNLAKGVSKKAFPPPKA